MKQELTRWPHWEAIGLNLTSPRSCSVEGEREREREAGGEKVKWEGVTRVDSKNINVSKIRKNSAVDLLSLFRLHLSCL